jgi:hypothetical protein
MFVFSSRVAGAGAGVRLCGASFSDNGRHPQHDASQIDTRTTRKKIRLLLMSCYYPHSVPCSHAGPNAVAKRCIPRWLEKSRMKTQVQCRRKRASRPACLGSRKARPSVRMARRFDAYGRGRRLSPHGNRRTASYTARSCRCRCRTRGTPRILRYPAGR